MNNLILNDIQMTSLELSEITGKEHKNIMRDIRNEMEALEYAELIFEPGTYKDANNQDRPCYTFGRDGAMQLALKYDAVTRRKVILKLNDLDQRKFPKLSPELQAIFSIDIKQQEHGERISHLESNMTLDYGQQRDLQIAGGKSAVASMGGYQSPAYSNKSLSSKVFSHMWRDLKDYFKVSSYRNIPKVKYQRAIEFLDNWKATGNVLREIEDTNMQMSME